MADYVIKVENLGKSYYIQHQQTERYTALRDILANKAKHLGQRLLGHSTKNTDSSQEEFWALKDICFEVKQGERIGIIGRNGAGKSTLLKILSRITEPTKGRVRIKGRVASLLEVGTGFHPELTGRENIYLNGSILGMRREEIKRKFDEIVAFADVEKFLDTPVKRYSSGMYVRLAFAVAAHLEPEILVVDEVLAVGDVAFQNKCLGKMDEVASEGRTVLFVSHNMAAIQLLCRRAILLDKSQVVQEGLTESIIDKYMSFTISQSIIPLNERTDRGGNGIIRLTSISIMNQNRDSIIKCNDSLFIKISFFSEKILSNVVFLIGIYDNLNRPIFFLDSEKAGGDTWISTVKGSVVCKTGAINITPGPCIVNVAVLVGGTMADHVGTVSIIHVEPSDFYGTGKLTDRGTSLCLLSQEWRVEKQ